MAGNYITTVVDGVLHIRELVPGDPPQAVEVARISLRHPTDAVVTELVVALMPHLAPAGLNVLRNGDGPKQGRRGGTYTSPAEREARAAVIRAYVAAHPGAVTSEVARAGGYSGASGSGTIAVLERAGLHGVRGEGKRGRSAAYRWYIDDPALKVAKRKDAAS